MRKVNCPVKNCHALRWPNEVLCKTHWWMVPKDLRDKIWRLFHQARGSQEHIAAIRQAIELVESPRASPPPGAA